MERQTVYFEEVGKGNTEKTLMLVQARLQETFIQKIVLASTTGDTARKALNMFSASQTQLVVVPHQFDFSSKANRFPAELVANLKAAGHDVHFGTMLFHTENLYQSQTPVLMADLLRCFSQGVKVCVEIVLMATDAGLLTPGEKVIAVAGTGLGADTALVMQAASSQHLKHLRILEMICKPLNERVEK